MQVLAQCATVRDRKRELYSVCVKHIQFLQQVCTRKTLQPRVE